MPRIVSLLPSSTEIVCALGFASELVGRSHECDFPESVRRLPACTAPKFDVDGTAAEIDGRVKALVRDGLSVYRVDAAMLRALRPEVIVTQTQCDVCAASLSDVEEAVATWVDRPARIVALAPATLEDVRRDVRRVAEALDASERGERLAAELAARMDAVARRARSLAPRPTVATIEWTSPLMAGGNWMPELVDGAGGENLFGERGEHSPWLRWEDLRAADPSVIVVAPCGLDLARIRREMPALERSEGWSSLRAVRSRRVALADGNQYFNRPGPRLADSLEILAEVFHPEAFDFGYEGRAWERF